MGRQASSHLRHDRWNALHKEAFRSRNSALKHRLIDHLYGIFASDPLGVITLVIITCFLVRAPLFWSTMNFLVLLGDIRSARLLPRLMVERI